MFHAAAACGVLHGGGGGLPGEGACQQVSRSARHPHLLSLPLLPSDKLSRLAALLGK